MKRRTSDATTKGNTPPITQLQQGSVEWYAARKKFPLTASEIPAVLGRSDFKKPHELLFQEKARKYGQAHEKEGADQFVRAFKITNPDYSVEETGLWPLPVLKPNVAASPDRIIKDESGKIIAVVEVKCPWRGVFYNGLVCETPKMKHDHYVQMQVQMACLGGGSMYGYYVCWTPGSAVILKVAFDSTLWETLIAPSIDAFVSHIEGWKIKVAHGTAVGGMNDLRMYTRPQTIGMKKELDESMEKNVSVYTSVIAAVKEPK